VRKGWPPVVSDVYGRLASYELVGASACVREIVGALAVLARAVADRDGDVLTELRVAGRDFCELKPETAVYRETVAWLLRGLDEAPPVEVASRIGVRVQRFLEQRERALEELAAEGAKIVSSVESVLVHDYSSTVMAVLRACAAAGSRLGVVATAAEPVGGGLRVASESAAVGHRATLIPDTGVARLLDDIDAVLIGVETAYIDGALANTVGTYAIALLARDAGLPVYALTDCLKIEPRRPRRHAELQAELLVDWPDRPPPAGVDVRTEVLDLTPGELLTAYVTERGVVAPSALAAAYASSRRELEELSAGT
jgi:ribose 1,5-bisphosphate isomerase